MNIQKLSNTDSDSREPTSQVYKKKSLADYEFLINEKGKDKTSELGKGSYGSVKKVMDKQTGQICAIKIVNKPENIQALTF